VRLVLRPPPPRTRRRHRRRRQPGSGDSPPPHRRAVRGTRRRQDTRRSKPDSDVTRPVCRRSKSESDDHTRRQEERESEEEHERRSPSQNQNVPDQPVQPLYPTPTPPLPGGKRHHLGQGSRPGGKMGRATPISNKVAAASTLAPDPRNMATPLLTAKPAIADLWSEEWVWVGSRTRLPFNEAQMDSDPLAARPRAPGPTRGLRGHRKRHRGPRAGLPEPAGPGRAGRARHPVRTRMFNSTQFDTPLRELQFVVSHGEFGRANSKLRGAESAGPGQAGRARHPHQSRTK